MRSINHSGKATAARKEQGGQTGVSEMGEDERPIFLLGGCQAERPQQHS